MQQGHFTHTRLYPQQADAQVLHHPLAQKAGFYALIEFVLIKHGREFLIDVYVNVNYDLFRFFRFSQQHFGFFFMRLNLRQIGLQVQQLCLQLDAVVCQHF